MEQVLLETIDILKEAHAALRPLAKLEFPANATDGQRVATTLHCNDQVTVHSVRKAREAMAHIQRQILALYASIERIVCEKPRVLGVVS